nr:malate:quinone oxidoreductase [Metabacillus dongyingensis]
MGAGVMSATLASLLKELAPKGKKVFEKCSCCLARRFPRGFCCRFARGIQ